MFYLMCSCTLCFDFQVVVLNMIVFISVGCISTKIKSSMYFFLINEISLIRKRDIYKRRQK